MLLADPELTEEQRAKVQLIIATRERYYIETEAHQRALFGHSETTSTTHRAGSDNTEDNRRQQENAARDRKK
jgi:hypothetical protein